MISTKLFVIQTYRELVRWKHVFLPLCLMCVPNLAWAQSANQVIETERSGMASNTQSTKSGSDCSPDKQNPEYKQYRFRPYQPSSAVWQYTHNDEHSAEVNYSFMYLISSPGEFDSESGGYFSYTGRFDFYMSTRSSSPVVNRISNPAFHFRWLDNNSAGLDWWDVAIEHKSNGQVISANEPLAPNSTQNRAAVEFNAGNHAYIDTISRSTNYISLEGHSSLSNKRTNFDLKIFAWHFYEESDVFWGKYAGQNVNFPDFERVRIGVQGDLGELSSDKALQNEYGLEWTVGDKGLATDSVNIWFKYPARLGGCVLPFTLRAHFGPMNELSNYTESQRSIGFGLAFYY